MIETRKRHPALGLGKYHELLVANPCVFAFVRELVAEDGTADVVLCVNNVSRFPQPVELDLAKWPASELIELTGSVEFPIIDASRCQLTMSGHGFFWFSIATGYWEGQS